MEKRVVSSYDLINMRHNRFPKVIELVLGRRGKNIKFFALVMVPNLIAALSEGLSFSLILMALTVLTSGADWNVPAYFQNTSFAQWLKEADVQFVFTFFIISAVLLQIARSALNYLGQIFSTYLGNRIQVDAQERVYRQIFRLSFPCVSQYKAGDLVDYAKIPTIIVQILMDTFNRILVSGSAILASIWVLFLLSAPLTFFAVVISAFFGLSQKYTISKISVISRVLNEYMVAFSKHTVQSLHALKVIHTFERQNQVMKKIEIMLSQIANSTKKLNLWNHSILPISEILGVLLVGVFLIAGQWVLKGQQTMMFPILLTFITVLHRLNARIQVLTTSVATIAGAWGQIIRLEEILSDEGKEYCSKEGISYQPFKHQIAFRDVDMQYKGTQAMALKGLNLEIAKGSSIAFVGYSGAGKSTIIDLMIGLYSPTNGRVEVDGVDLKTIQMPQWRQALGVVSQDSFMFNDTIEDNIRFGRPDATLEEIIESARIAGAHDFIERLPHGYQTHIGERGHRLSGGERQRISLARAIVRDPEILILDEATSSLDSYSERCIQVALERFKGEKTMIIIAHRLSTVVDADLIVVLQNGMVIEKGKHTELLAKDGTYAFFWNIQKRKGLREELFTDTVKNYL